MPPRTPCVCCGARLNVRKRSRDGVRLCVEGPCRTAEYALLNVRHLVAPCDNEARAALRGVVLRLGSAARESLLCYRKDLEAVAAEAAASRARQKARAEALSRERRLNALLVRAAMQSLGATRRDASAFPTLRAAMRTGFASVPRGLVTVPRLSFATAELFVLEALQLDGFLRICWLSMRQTVRAPFATLAYGAPDGDFVRYIMYTAQLGDAAAVLAAEPAVVRAAWRGYLEHRCVPPELDGCAMWPWLSRPSARVAAHAGAFAPPCDSPLPVAPALRWSPAVHLDAMRPWAVTACRELVLCLAVHPQGRWLCDDLVMHIVRMLAESTRPGEDALAALAARGRLPAWAS